MYYIVTMEENSHTSELQGQKKKKSQQATKKKKVQDEVELRSVPTLQYYLENLTSKL